MKQILLQGPANSRSGYGDHFRDIVGSLIRDGKHEIKIVNTNWGACPNNALSDDSEMNKSIQSCIIDPSTVKAQPDLFIVCSIPTDFIPRGKKNLGITAGIEVNLCGMDFIKGVNNMDRVIVPSKFTKDVLMQTVYDQMNNQKQKVGELRTAKPIDVVFEGLDISIYNKDATAESVNDILDKVPESFAFLAAGHWLQGDLGQDRKDMGMVVKTFCEAFKNRKNTPALILKTSGAGFSILDRNEMLTRIDKIKATIKDAKKLPEVYLLHGDLTDKEMAAMYNHPKIKAMVSFTKGEGYGRPLLEFAATGKPILVSNWSGHLDFMNPKYTELLPGNLTQIHKSARWDEKMFPEQARWFTVHYPTAKQVIQNVFENYKDYLKKSRGSAHYVKTNFSMDKMDEQIVKIVDEMLADVPSTVPFAMPAPGTLPNLPNLQ